MRTLPSQVGVLLLANDNLYSECSQSGVMVDSVSSPKPPSFCLAMKVFKKQQRSHLSSPLRWGVQSGHHPSLPAGSCAGCRLLLIFLYVLSSSYIWESPDGSAREEIRSSVNFLFFISASLVYGENQQAGQGIGWLKIWKVCLGWRWVAHWGAWLKG